jgi:hypothetical protein
MEREDRARRALQDIALQMADEWASGLKNRPTQQLVLQKLIEPVVRHILNTIFPWVVGVAICFLILLICTVVTCVIVLRSGSWVPVAATAASVIL